jgi:F-type H+-transporting ATPase subunit b
MTHRVAALVGSALSLTAQLALASEEPHAHGGGIPFSSLAFSAVNLFIFIWILGRYVLPPVRTWVADRRRRVVSDLEAAAAAKAEAARLRAEWEDRLARLDQTITELRTQAQRDAERERERILAAAQRTAEAIRRDAERAAAYELRRVQVQLRADLVREAVRLAEESARAQWSGADQQRFVADFLKQVAP